MKKMYCIVLAVVLSLAMLMTELYGAAGDARHTLHRE